MRAFRAISAVLAATLVLALGLPAHAATHRRHHRAHARSLDGVAYHHAPDFVPPRGLGGGILSGDAILDSGYFDGFGLPGAPSGQGAIGLGFFGL